MTVECECGCGGIGGHVLSGERWEAQSRCGAVKVTVGADKVLRQHKCEKVWGHSALVPHSEGEVLWSNEEELRG